MSRQRSREKRAVGENPWDRAISDAKQLLRKVEAKARRVRLAILEFEQGRANGESWSGSFPSAIRDTDTQASTRN